MKTKKNTQWLRLDNAAKVFPATSGKKDTKVFRIACELRELVKEKYLQQALEITLKEFPVFCSVLRKGLFWYYLETTSRKAVVHEESQQPCSPLYDRNRRRMLFRVFYYKRRINLEVHHALTDGTGAIMFLNSLVANYLFLVHHEELKDLPVALELDASVVQRHDDSFYRYYDDTNKQSVTAAVTEPSRRAYCLHGTRLSENRMKVIEGHLSVQDVKKLAKSNDTTVTVYLTALLLCAIRDVMTVRERKHPIGIMVPVNLRSYFKSASVRNFFGTIDIEYDFSKNSGEFKDVLLFVEQAFKLELTKEKMEQRLNHLVALENHLLMRVVPLCVKDFVIKRVYRRSEQKYTSTLSNVGKITMPEALEPYISRYSVFVSTEKKQVCVCSYQDNLVISFTSPLIGAEVERNFFRALTKQGAAVEIACTSGWED